MGGERLGSEPHPSSSNKCVFHFQQRVPIPSYLIALVVGALESRYLCFHTHRTSNGVWNYSVSSCWLAEKLVLGVMCGVRRRWWIKLPGSLKRCVYVCVCVCVCVCVHACVQRERERETSSWKYMYLLLNLHRQKKCFVLLRKLQVNTCGASMTCSFCLPHFPMEAWKTPASLLYLLPYWWVDWVIQLYVFQHFWCLLLTRSWPSDVAARTLITNNPFSFPGWW